MTMLARTLVTGSSTLLAPSGVRAAVAIARITRTYSTPTASPTPTPPSSSTAAAPRAGRRPIALPTAPAPAAEPASTPAVDASAGGAISYEPLPRHIGARRGVLLVSLPIPPASWPSHLEPMSPLLADASAELKKRGLAVLAVYDGVGTASFPRLGEEEVYPATLVFPDGRRFSFPALSRETLTDPLFLKGADYRPLDTSRAAPNALPVARGGPEVLVCTHGARDCRCSERGGPLVAALRGEFARSGVNIPVREVAHVGGHKWAANAIVVPALDMLSNLAASDAPDLAAHVIGNRPPSSRMWQHWRGRFGMDEEQQADVWAKIEAGIAAAAAPPDTAAASEKPHTHTGKTVPLTFKLHSGEKRVVHARLGDTLLDVGQEHGLPSIEGVCGGNLECATCHVYLNPSPVPAPVADPTDDELDMLEFAVDYNDEASRLGCQIEVTPQLAQWVEEGGVIELPRF